MNCESMSAVTAAGAGMGSDSPIKATKIFFEITIPSTSALLENLAMSQPTAETIDDILYCARYGELEELSNANFPALYFAASDECGNTALHMACANGHLSMYPKLYSISI